MQSISIDRTDQRIGLFDRGWPIPRAPQRRYYELHLDEGGTTTWRRWRRSTTSNCLCRIHQSSCSLFISLSGFRPLRARARGPARARSQPGRRKATPATENDLSSPQTAVVRMWPTYVAPGRQYPAWLCRSASALTCFEREEIANSVLFSVRWGPSGGPTGRGAVFFLGLSAWQRVGPTGPPVSGSNFAPAPRPAAPHTAGLGGPPGPKSALGRSPSCQRPPWGWWAWWLWLGALEQPVTGLYGPGVE